MLDAHQEHRPQAQQKEFVILSVRCTQDQGMNSFNAGGLQEDREAGSSLGIDTYTPGCLSSHARSWATASLGLLQRDITAIAPILHGAKWPYEVQSLLAITDVKNQGFSVRYNQKSGIKRSVITIKDVKNQGFLSGIAGNPV